jgi:hypothetical protein
VCRSGAFKFSRLVPSCDVRYDFHVKLMCDSGRVLFLLFVFIFVYWCPTRFMWCNICWPFRSTHVFSGAHVAISLVFWRMFYGSLFVLLWFFFCPLCCMSFFGLRLLITPLVSSNYSHLNMWCSPSKKINNVSTENIIIQSKDCWILILEFK